MKIWWTSEVFIMAVLCLTTNADNKAETCEVEIKVRRHTEYTAKIGQQLNIKCPVNICDNSIPTIYWFKFDTKGFIRVNTNNNVMFKWTRKNNNGEGVSFLIFQKVVISDAGQYQCQHQHSVSHTINVTVTVTDGSVNVNGTSPDLLNGTFTSSHNDNLQMWLYLYSAVGIGGIVIIVIVISVLALRGCKGKAKKGSQCENQYMDIPMVEQPQHHTSNQTLPRRSPREPPTRASRKQKSPLPVPPRDNVYGQRGDRERQRNGPVEEWSSVVYAALNHQHMAAATPRQRMEVEETSEYAAIRVS